MKQLMKSFPRLLRCALVLGMALGPLAALSGQTEIYRDGFQAWRQKNYAQSFQLMKSGAAVDSPVRDYFLFYAGRSALQTGDSAAAISMFGELLARRSESLLRGRAEQYN